MKFQPVGEFIMLKEKTEDRTTNAGIIIPNDSSFDQINMAEVVGKGERVPDTINIGDTVVFRSSMFDEIEYNSAKYRFGKEDSIFAVIHNA